MAGKYDYTYLEAVRQKDMGNYVLAFELYKRCLEMDPDASEAHYGIGNLYMGMKMDSLALVHLTKATELEPGNTEYL
jgi:tetratricopeptide (TPR) repeat protein